MAAIRGLSPCPDNLERCIQNGFSGRFFEKGLYLQNKYGILHKINAEKKVAFPKMRAHRERTSLAESGAAQGMGISLWSRAGERYTVVRFGSAPLSAQ